MQARWPLALKICRACTDRIEGEITCCAQAGLEDWELARIRVNVLQRAGAQDLLDRLSLLSPLPGHSVGRRSGDSPGGNAFQKIFFKRSARATRPLQRWAASAAPRKKALCHVLSQH